MVRREISPSLYSGEPKATTEAFAITVLSRSKKAASTGAELRVPTSPGIPGAVGRCRYARITDPVPPGPDRPVMAPPFPSVVPVRLRSRVVTALLVGVAITAVCAGGSRAGADPAASIVFNGR